VRHQSVPPAAKQLFEDFLEQFLEIEFIGFQSGFGLRDDLILFYGPHGSSLSVPTKVMLLNRDEAVEQIRQKVLASEKAFAAQPPARNRLAGAA
jgi:hypothetical protein